jgi:DNA-binding transcriptional LysR family regulator
MPWDERIRQRLKLRDLYVLQKAAQLGSMGKAGNDLALSQPAVSKAITDLERALGVRLLDRNRQGVEPTLYGTALLRWSAAVFDDLKLAVEEIDYLGDPTGGKVRIGTGEGMPAGLIAAVIDHLRQQYPRLRFVVIQAATNDLQYRDLRERNVDLVFGRVITPVAENDLSAEILFEDSFYPVAGSKSKWANRRRIDPAELVNEPWCLSEDSQLFSAFARAFHARGLKAPSPIISTNSIQLHYAMAATGRVLALGSAARLRLAAAKPIGVTALAVDLVVLANPIGIVTLKNRSLSAVAQIFIECARQVVKSVFNT